MDEKNAPAPWRTRAVRVSLLVTVALLNACGGSTDAVKALPAPTASADFEQRKDNMFLVEPVSAPIEQEVEYEFEIHTHCGLEDAWVDVDGSLWDFDGPMEGEDSARLDG
ncbi:MAG: hypothetical protein ACR2KQ_11390 [Actinomycetota bacterium]